MTSASELFYQRRSRVGRVTTTDSEFEPSSSDRHFLSSYNRRHHHPSHNHIRHDFDGCDPLRRSPHLRNPCRRLSPVSERGSFRVDQSAFQSASANSSSTEGLSSSSSTNGTRLNGNDRLPGAVLLARARLIERLRGVSASENRQSRRVSFDIANTDYTFGGDLRVVDGVDWGTGSLLSFSGSTNQTGRLQVIRESYKNKPPGLTSEDIDRLQLEVFSFLEKGETTRLSRECSICLESFEEGDKLIHLHCEHRFHAACLDRWIRTCGECPYCRRDIVLSSHTP